VQFALQPGQQVVQGRRKIVRLRACRSLQSRLDTREFIGQHSLQQIELPRKISVKRFLADPQLERKIIHGHTAEAVTEEVPPGSIDNAPAIDVMLSPLRP